MPTLYITHTACLDHLTPLGHPERPDRLKAIERALEDETFMGLARDTAPMATLEAAMLAHPTDYVERIAAASPEEGLVRIDADTTISPGSLEAARRGVGAAQMAVDEVMTRKVHNAFCAVRPPGHHAERDRAMGFCLFNNAAIAAYHAKQAHGAERVAVVDVDVHHGNGTQDIFWNDPSMLYVSTHQMPLYPGTGGIDERGADDAGNIVNVPLNPGDGSMEFREAMEIVVLPAIDRFQPDLIIVSAGFDAHTRDPLANIHLVEADFAWATKKLMELADKHAGSRLVSLLEGGYDLMGLALSTAAHVRALMRV
ncbi:MAG: histone deacetylase family protein [Pseudomonadota bacterium]